mmetsp:Transcript_35427/g.111673  ORF Transcript_35427/g.111673 Transcript_35427/m.111673 type:complete len:208 (+) Transcript_35427:27-650(+)
MDLRTVINPVNQEQSSTHTTSAGVVRVCARLITHGASAGPALRTRPLRPLSPHSAGAAAVAAAPSWRRSPPAERRQRGALRAARPVRPESRLVTRPAYATLNASTPDPPPRRVRTVEAPHCSACPWDRSVARRRCRLRCWSRSRAGPGPRPTGAPVARARLRRRRRRRRRQWTLRGTRRKNAGPTAPRPRPQNRSPRRTRPARREGP